LADDEARKAEADAGGEKAASSTNELSGTVLGPSVQAGSVHGGIQFNVAAPPQLPVPAQLPSPGFFANRREELSDLQRLAGESREAGSPMLVVITGTGGVGKTTLGLHWLHQIRERYDAGQLFVDLRGFSGSDPMPSSEPLERFLRALGIGAESVPVNPDEQAAMFRSLTADRPFIVMLDNAASAAQVRPLLPGPGPALVVVTTRRRLSGLIMEGARFVDVRPLHESGAVELLNRILGADRVQAQRRDAESLVRLCGLLPLAVCASAARLAARSRWPIARVVAELNDETRRLSTLRVEDGDMSVQAVFNASYHALPEETARRQYRLLGLHPGADFDVGAAAAVAGVDQEDAADLLDTLVGANLLQEGQGNRYQFHDLIRLHARSKAHEDESDSGRRAAFERLTDWYLKTAVADARSKITDRSKAAQRPWPGWNWSGPTSWRWCDGHTRKSCTRPRGRSVKRSGRCSCFTSTIGAGFSPTRPV
jgi:hypothetical protein